MHGAAQCRALLSGSSLNSRAFSRIRGAPPGYGVLFVGGGPELVHTGAIQLDRGGLAGEASPSSLGHRVAQGLDGGASSQVPLFVQAGGVPLHRASVCDEDRLWRGGVGHTRRRRVWGRAPCSLSRFHADLEGAPCIVRGRGCVPNRLHEAAEQRSLFERRQERRSGAPPTTYCRHTIDMYPPVKNYTL